MIAVVVSYLLSEMIHAHLFITRPVQRICVRVFYASLKKLLVIYVKHLPLRPHLRHM